MKKNKSSKQDVLITAFVVVVVTIGFIGGFVLAGDLKDRLYFATEKNENSENSDILVASKSGEKTYGFNEKFVESNSDLDYTINFGTYAGSTGAYFTVNYGDTKNDLLITKYNYDNDDSQEYTMEFTNNVVDVYLGQFDNDPQYNTLFYLLDNGDVCYSLIEDMVQNNDYGSYYTIENLSNVVKFYSGNSCNEELGECKTTTFAQTVNGKIYDLVEYVK